VLIFLIPVYYDKLLCYAIDIVAGNISCCANIFLLCFSVTKIFWYDMQATVQDCEVQCVEGHPCWVKEWCSEEGIYWCLSKISKIFESSIIVILMLLSVFHLY
jgi:hypothetical protein